MAKFKEINVCPSPEAISTAAINLGEKASK